MSISLSGNKIRLRAVEPFDADLIFEWENNINIWSIGTTLTPFSKYEIKQYVNLASRDIFATRQLRLMIEINSNESLSVGTIDLFDFDPFHLRAGVGILIAEEQYRQRGFAGEALQLLIDYAFKILLLKQLYCTVPKNNKASIKLFSSNGFVKCGIQREWLRTKNGWLDVLTMQLINSNF